MFLDKQPSISKQGEGGLVGRWDRRRYSHHPLITSEGQKPKRVARRVQTAKESKKDDVNIRAGAATVQSWEMSLEHSALSWIACLRRGGLRAQRCSKLGCSTLVLAGGWTDLGQPGDLISLGACSLSITRSSCGA